MLLVINQSRTLHDNTAILYNMHMIVKTGTYRLWSSSIYHWNETRVNSHYTTQILCIANHENRYIWQVQVIFADFSLATSTSSHACITGEVVAHKMNSNILIKHCICLAIYSLHLLLFNKVFLLDHSLHNSFVCKTWKNNCSKSSVPVILFRHTKLSTLKWIIAQYCQCLGHVYYITFLFLRCLELAETAWFVSSFLPGWLC